MGLFATTKLPGTAGDALPGRALPLPSAPPLSGPMHAVLGTEMAGEVPIGYAVLVVGMGCFWGAERLFWQLPGVYSTAVGYAGGFTPNPTYDEVCSGRSGHSEVVRIVYNQQQISLVTLLKVFWDSHDPTQGMRQGNDRGTQYRSVIYVATAEDEASVLASRDAFARQLQVANLGSITTEIKRDQRFYFAEDYHQQYLHKNPMGYCGIRGTGVTCSV
ncbi:MAG: peptide-methionine (S)-S-oxide reductase MsrA [Natronospirillum sp.]